MTASPATGPTGTLSVGAEADPDVQAALRRNDRYLQEFIEPLTICPYAKTCREQGRLYRGVFLQVQPHALAVAEFLLSLDPDRLYEIGLLLFPNFAGIGQVGPSLPFERFVTDVRNQYTRLRKPPAFFIVAFHPHLPSNLSNPDVAVRFMRRSPDPTIQLVRPEVIDAVRNPHHNRDELSTAIAEMGLKTVRSIGVEKIEESLVDIHHHERKPPTT